MDRPWWSLIIIFFCRCCLLCFVFLTRKASFQMQGCSSMAAWASLSHACCSSLPLLILFLYKRDVFVLAQALEQLNSGPVQSPDWKLILHTDSNTGKWWIGNKQRGRIVRNMAVCIYIWKSCCETESEWRLSWRNNYKNVLCHYKMSFLKTSNNYFKIIVLLMLIKVVPALWSLYEFINFKA